MPMSKVESAGFVIRQNVPEARLSLHLHQYCVCGVVHHCSHTAHIHDDKLVTCYKNVSEHYGDCNESSSPYVQGRRQLDLVL